jgi:cell division protein FtsN
MSDQESDQKLQQPENLGKFTTKVVATVAAITAITASLSEIAKDSNTITSNLPFLKSKSTAASSPSNLTASSSTDQVFYVIAGQSKYPDNLRQEPKRAVGLEFTRSFPNIKMCPSKVDSTTHYLVLGSNLSQTEAEAVKQQAIVNNFRSDTYVQPEKELFFAPSSCSNVRG